eukprot:g34473.t1
MQNLLLLQTMGVDVKEDLQEVRSQKALFFASEASKIIFWSRVRSVDETCSHFFFQKITKILSKAITNRVRSALESVIHPDQTYAVR